MFPSPLVGKTHLGAFICDAWELRVTRRCLQDDLGAKPDATFDDVARHDIVKAFVSRRRTKTTDTRQVAPLTCGRPVWVVARGHDHRGGTWFDEDHRVVWLLAYALHRSGSRDDFFPYCKDLDQDDVLLPAPEDYERLFTERADRFVRCVAIEAPLVLRLARDRPGEHAVMLGGEYGACVTVEIAGEVAETTIAFVAGTLSRELIQVVLTAFHAKADWEPAIRLPSRDLRPDEIAFAHMHPTAEATGDRGA